MRREGGKEKLKHKIDWKQFGQFLKMVLDLFTIVTTELKKRKVGPEILEWMTGPGKAVFADECLVPLVDEYDEWRNASAKNGKQKPLTAEVDLDADPVAPFDGAKRTKHQKQGKVAVEYRPDEDELYVKGKKVVPWFSDAQKSGKVVRGDILQPEAEQNNPLNATLADWLYGAQEFIPQKWQGRVWFFWATEWSDSGRYRCVRCLRWHGSRWYRVHDWLESGWYDGFPSASLAS